MSDPRMSRSEFLREGLSRFFQGMWGDAALEETPASLEAPARPTGWPRPPGALPEPEFLATCTRCDQCVKVCPHWALKVAGLRDGPPPGTPFLHDPASAACATCPDMPCITACEPGALRKAEG